MSTVVPKSSFHISLITLLCHFAANIIVIVIIVSMGMGKPPESALERVPETGSQLVPLQARLLQKLLRQNTRLGWIYLRSYFLLKNLLGPSHGDLLQWHSHISPRLLGCSFPQPMLFVLSACQIYFGWEYFLSCDNLCSWLPWLNCSITNTKEQSAQENWPMINQPLLLTSLSLAVELGQVRG